MKTCIALLLVLLVAVVPAFAQDAPTCTVDVTAA